MRDLGFVIWSFLRHWTFVIRHFPATCVCHGRLSHKEQIAVPAVTKNARVCETCGSPIDTTSAGDLGCIACLIGTGLDAEAEQGEAPFASAPDQLGAYTIEHNADGTAWELGRGAMGVTYRAIDKALDRPVALKIISAARGSHSAEARERFMREARAAAALRHPNVATVYQFGVREESGQFFYAMELVEGETLEERVRRLGPLDVLTTIDIALQVTAALEAAEERGLVHRDLKPGNLMLVGGCDNGEEVGRAQACPEPRRMGARRERTASRSRGIPTIKVIDFGVAKAVAEKTNAMALTHGGFVGTPAFASPEQFTNAPVDVRSDIYSLGVTLWLLLTGHMLFSGRTVEEIQEARRSKPLPIEQLKAARVPRRFVSLLASMLAIEPAARPAGARELTARLQAIRASITDRGKTARRLAISAAIVGLAAIVAVRVFQSSSTKPTLSTIPEKGIAVLPFENLSREPDNAYFAEGIQEEILTLLAKIADLKVISRASTERYQNKPRDLAEIAKQLGVPNVLEGSVQKAGNQIRVNVQLINAQTDSHLWAETYDRKLTDIFAIESEIARRIAESLQTKLTGSERQALAAKRTNNPAAYDAYLRGRAFADASNWIASNVESSIQSYQHAVALDPAFALAWARLSFEQMWSYWQGFDASPARLRAAKEATDRAVALDPDLSEVRRALGYYRYWAERDFSGALAEFRAARDGAPNDAEMIEAVAVIQRRIGHFDEAIAEIHRAIELNPRHVLAYQFLAETLGQVRRFPEALAAVESASILQPADAASLRLKANLLWRSTGDVQAVEPLLANSTSEPEIRARQFLFQRDYAAAIGVLSKSLPATTADQRMGGYLPERQELQLLLGLSQQRAGDTSAARATYQQAVQDIRRAFASVASGSNMEAALHSALGEAYAGLDEADAALDEGRKATAIIPASKDLAEFTVYEEKMARIFAQLGDAGRAIDLLKRLLQTPYDFAITPGLLRLDPIWDPVRADPRFLKLCEEKQP